MSKLYHLRLDIRKVQDYIFQVPKLKFMLGANSKIGELFSTTLPELMKGSVCVFSEEQLNCIKNEKVKKQFGKNILSSSGGHFEAVFDCADKRKAFITLSEKQISQDLPDLEYSINWREFSKEDSLAEFNKLKVNPVSPSCVNTNWYDMPYYELCNQDGVSCATATVIDQDDKEEKIGDKARLMNQQADRFYKLQTKDAIATFYNELSIYGNKLANTLTDLADCGNSLKDNMLAYIKIDGNGTGARFREMKAGIETEPVLDGFIKVEEFWAENRGRIWDSLQVTLQGEAITKYQGAKLPYLLLMLGGDDLFLVCIPEIALHIATTLAEKMGKNYPISAGIAYVKESYPIALANHLAESCLESAKAGSYREEGKPAYLDWHVHFDSIYQDITDIRKNAYMLQYTDAEKTNVTEILCLRPYSLEATQKLLQEVVDMAEKLDDPKKETANNKVKGYRSVLKNGEAEVGFYSKMLLAGEQELKDFMCSYTSVIHKASHKILLNSALDKIELLEFYREKNEKEGAKCKS